MLNDFLVRATLGGIGVAVAAAPLGCFVLWRRMAYFGEATAHAAILGVALGLALDLPVIPGVLLASMAMAWAVTRLTAQGQSTDSALGVLSHSALALGLVAMSFLPNVRFDLTALLFGDILAIGRGDLVVIWIGAAAIVGLAAWRWNNLLVATVDPDLAVASGVDPRREELGLMLGLAVVIALALKVVGVLLITALLIIPAAAARPLARTPEIMVVLAGAAGVVSVFGGLALAVVADTPAGPSIVCAAAILFAASHVAARHRAT